MAGITFERMASGDGTYTVNVMIDGQRIQRVVGRESDGTTRTQAEDYIAQLRHDAKHDRLTLPKGRKLMLSFRNAATKYIARHEKTGGSSIAKKRRQLELQLVPFFGDTPLSKITSFDIERFKKLRREQKVMKCSTKCSGETPAGRLPESNSVHPAR